jgi:hypothetical protein
MLRTTSYGAFAANQLRNDIPKAGNIMSRIEQGIKKATGSLMGNLFSKKNGNQSQENALSAQPLLSERGKGIALKETRRTLNQANISSSLPLSLGIGDKNHALLKNKREEKQLHKDNKQKAVQLCKYPSSNPLQSKSLDLLILP